MLYTSVTSIERGRGQEMNLRTFQCLQTRTGGGSSKDQESHQGGRRRPGEYRVKEAKWGRGRPMGPRAAQGSGKMRTAGLSNIEDSDWQEIV